MNEETKFGAFSKEVALILDISTSNLRKWSILLEKEGYEFERNDKDQRIYYDRDINVLSQLKIVLEKNRNIDDAIKAVMKRVKENDNVEKTLSVIRKNSDEITLSKSDLNDLISTAVKEALSVQRQEMEPLFRGFQQMAALQEERKALPSPKDEWITRRRLESKFRQEAIKLWDQKPEEERMVRSGLFRKIENQSKRSDFIQDYIDQKLIEEYEDNN